MSEDLKKLDNKQLNELVNKLIEEERKSLEKRKAELQPKPQPAKSTVSFFEHVADVAVQWLLKKFFPASVVVPKDAVVELKELRQDNKAYKKITGTLQTLMSQGDYNRSLATLAQMSGRYWANLTPEAYKRLIETPDIKVCDHQKGFRRRSGRRPGTVVDYNIWDHRFIDGRREVRCLNHCGWKSSPGDANWPIARIMLEKTSNMSTASEQPIPHRDPDGPQIYPGDIVPEKKGTN